MLTNYFIEAEFPVSMSQKVKAKHFTKETPYHSYKDKLTHTDPGWLLIFDISARN